MKNKFIILGCLLTFLGCDSYLDEVPDNRQSITTFEDIKQILVSSYSEGTDKFVEWKTDNVVAIDDNTQKDWMTENYQFIPVVSDEDQDTPTGLWENNYRAIAHSNQALQGLDDIEDGDANLRDALKGEALITRAYNHFIIANVFCQHYSEENKNSLGIPYITAPETKLKVRYKRGTLEETYNLIEKDLLEALPLISDEYYVGSGKYHFNKKAAIAFASRFYLFKGEWEKCIEYSNQLLGNGTISTTYVRDMNAVFTGSFDVRAANFIDVSSPTNLLVVRKESWSNRDYWGYRSNTAIFTEIYKGTYDFRNSPYSLGTKARFQPKYNELFRNTGNNFGFGYFIMPELRSEEVILSRMESFVRLNRIDEALNDYNVMAPLRYGDGGQLTLEVIVDYFRDKDGPIDQIGGLSDEQKGMLKFVISERRKEFLNEGLRWFDIKRLNMGVTHIDVNGNEFTLKPKDLKKAVQIPVKAIANGIEANPR